MPVNDHCAHMRTHAHTRTHTHTHTHTHTCTHISAHGQPTIFIQANGNKPIFTRKHKSKKNMEHKILYVLKEDLLAAITVKFDLELITGNRKRQRRVEREREKGGGGVGDSDCSNFLPGIPHKTISHKWSCKTHTSTKILKLARIRVQARAMFYGIHPEVKKQ